MSQAKRNSLIFLAAAAILVLILAMSLPNLVLLPGQSFSLGQPAPSGTGANGMAPLSDALLWAIRGFMGLALILLPVYIGYSLVTAQGRRRLLVTVVMVVLLLLLAQYLEDHPFSQDNQPPPQPAYNNQNPDGLASPATTIFPNNPPVWLTIVVIAAASALAVAVVLAALWFFRRREPVPDLSLDLLADAAQSTIETLEAGGDFKASVIACYLEMSRVVKQEKGIAREIAMTPREFEDRLVSKGLPQAPIATLTRLFEQVRYGSRTAGTRDDDLALACLTDIVQACKTLRTRREDR